MTTNDSMGFGTAESPPAGESVRDRIVASALREFAAHGIAGARVDRIAREAKTSKERVYAYFRSKEILYAETAAQQLDVIMRATALDAADLPGYAGRLFDYYATHSDHFRLVSWGRLELTSSTRTDESSRTAAIESKLELLREAQRNGSLDPSWDPIDALALVSQIATTWNSQPELADAASTSALDRSTSARRAVVVAAVRRIFPPRPVE